MSSTRKLPAAMILASALVLAAAPARAVPFDAAHDTRCENAALRLVGLVPVLQAQARRAWGGDMPGTGALPQGFGYDAGGCPAYKLPADGGTKRVQIDVEADELGRLAFGVSDTAGLSRNANVDFGGSNRAPLQSQMNNANEGPAVIDTPDSDDGTIETIPVAQIAIAVALRIPDGCEIPTSAARQLSRTRLEGAFGNPPRAGTHPPFDQWFELFGSNIKASPGSPLTDQQCGAKKFRVVAPDPSQPTDDTTLLFKRYLQAASWNGGSHTNYTPGDLAETAFPPTLQPLYAAGGPPARLDAMAGLGVSGGITYAELATARVKGFGWDYANGALDPHDRTIWVRVQHIADDAYIGPAKVDDQLGAKGARCGDAVYANMPESTATTWAAVDDVSTTVGYPICALSYTLAWKSPAEVGIVNQSRARGRKDYIGYTLSPAGQGKLAGGDYAPLPPPVLQLALDGWADLEA